MLSLLGSIIGFLGSTAPSIVDHFGKKEENKLRLEMMKMQTELAKEHAEIDLTKFQAMALDNEHQRLIAHDIAIQQDIGPLSWLRKSVRPIITYLFFSLFAAVKISALVVALETTQDFNSAILVVWDEETQAIFAAIISFWFGSRALEKNIFNRR